jgi:hypothetical protein
MARAEGQFFMPFDKSARSAANVRLARTAQLKNDHPSYRAAFLGV